MNEYYIFKMDLAKGGFGIVLKNFILNDPKGREWKIKPVFEGSFENCFIEKKRLIKQNSTTI